MADLHILKTGIRRDEAAEQYLRDVEDRTYEALDHLGLAEIIGILEAIKTTIIMNAAGDE